MTTVSFYYYFYFIHQNETKEKKRTTPNKNNKKKLDINRFLDATTILLPTTSRIKFYGTSFATQEGRKKKERTNVRNITISGKCVHKFKCM